MKSFSKCLTPLIVLTVGLAGTVMFLWTIFARDFQVLPGDMGDTRLNLLFLEHSYQLFLGQVDQYWGPFWSFYPHPLSLGYSDNLLGAAPFYAAFREMGLSLSHSMQGWLILCSFLNYLAAYLLLKKLGFGVWGSIVGGFLFAFGLPRNQHLNHPQLIPHFFTPLCFYFLVSYWDESSKRRICYLGLAALAAVWQLWAGVYLGWFLFFGLSFVLLYLLVVSDLRKSLFGKFWQDRWWLLLVLTVATLALIPMAIPYYQVKAERGGILWEHAFNLSPAWRSYLMPSERSYFYKGLINFSGSYHTPWERIFFPGTIPLLAIVGLFFYLIAKTRKQSLQRITWFAIISYFIVSLLIVRHGSFWPWYYIHEYFPAASALRAVGRINLLMLLSLGVVVAFLVNLIWQKRGVLPKVLSVTLGIAIMLEHMTLDSGSYSIDAHERRLRGVTSLLVEARLKKSCDLFYLRPKGNLVLTHLDGMFVSLKTKTPTLNGYSGGIPKNWNLERLQEGLDLNEDIDLWLKHHDSSYTSENVCIISP